MQDIWQKTDEWTKSGRPFALARVISTWGSAPRAVGAAMIVDAQLQIAGSVSGGCIEGAVIEEAQQVLQHGDARCLEYGVEDETAWSVGLSCGGEVSVLVERHWACVPDGPVRTVWAALEAAINANQPAILLTRLPSQPQATVPSSPLDGHLLVYPDGRSLGDWGSLTAEAVAAGQAAYKERRSHQTQIGGQDVFVHVFPRRDELLVIGAGHISIPLVGFAQALDFRTAVIDPRQVFATPERFPTAPDQLLAQWPHAALEDRDLHDDTYAVVLTHDPKIDDEALHYFLRVPIAYIGALGSRKSHAKRCARLREAGFSDADIARIKGPVGLDIRAQTPAEIALSIMAEIVAVKRGR